MTNVALKRDLLTFREVLWRLRRIREAWMVDLPVPRLLWSCKRKQLDVSQCCI